MNDYFGKSREAQRDMAIVIQEVNERFMTGRMLSILAIVIENNPEEPNKPFIRTRAIVRPECAGMVAVGIDRWLTEYSRATMTDGIPPPELVPPAKPVEIVIERKRRKRK